MISIQERPSKKAVGQTSLFVSFEYDPKVIEIVKSAGDAIWDKKEKIWELPVNKLAFLIDNLTYLDDIDLNVLEDSKEKELELTIDYKTKPFEYQLEDIKWLINNPNSLNLNCPGLGKTLELIYTAEELKAQKGIEHCLIICGINTLKQNWKKEIEMHSNLDCVVIGEKINSKGNITYTSIKERAEQLYEPIKEFFAIINVESCRDNLIVDAIKNSKNHFDMIVLDECHKCLDYNSIINTNFGDFRIGDIIENKLYYNKLLVLSYNEITGSLEYQPITSVYKNYTNKLMELEIEENGVIHKLKCTPDHKIFTMNRGWVQAQCLTDKDDIKII